MAEYNPSKIIKDGNTYNFRDTTKIPLAGTNALSGSIIPSTDNAYDLGSNSYSFNRTFTLYVQGNNTKELSLFSSNNIYDPWNRGAYLSLFTNDYSTVAERTGTFTLAAVGLNDTKVALTGTPSGTLTWGSKNVAMAEDVVPRSGGAVLNGQTYARNVDNESLLFIGGTAYNLGAYIELYGKNHSSRGGQVSISCRKSDGTAMSLLLYPNGTLTWGSKNVAMQEDTIPRSGGPVITGSTLGRNGDTGILDICGGTQREHGAYIALCGASYIYDTYAGLVRLNAYKNSSNNKGMELYPNGTWTWNGTACQITSDQRYKQQISEIDDKLLDAWEDVNLVQFKYNDAVDTKGDTARLHTGYVVQQIDNACKKHGVDISAYGLYCHEEYPQETEEVEVENEDGTKTKETKVIREASEHYSLRYTEALIVECAYLRKCIARLTARIEELEKGNNVK